MANVFKPKRTSTASLVPTTTNLVSGEMGVNMADQKIYINNGTSVVQIGTAKISGATDVTLTSLTSGQTLQWDGTAWVNVTGGSSTLTVGSTATSGGAAGQIMFDTGSVLQESSNLVWDNTAKRLTISGYSLTGTAADSLLDLSGTWNTTGTPTALKLNVTDTASNASSLLMNLQVGGTSQFSVNKVGLTRLSSITLGSGSFGGADVSWWSSNALNIRLTASFTINNDLRLRRRAAANLQLGAADAAAPVAQTLSVQSVVAGTTNTAGANLTITGSQGTGTGAGGSIIFQVAPAGSSGTAQNALATFAEITSTRAINLYNTTDVTTNYERGFLRWSSNQFQIGQEVGGTGVARAVVISGKSWTADSTDGTTATVTSSGRTDFNINATSANFAVFNFTRNNNQIWNYYLNNSTDDFSIAKVGVGPIITFLAGGNIQIRSNSLLQFSTDLSLRRRGAANLALGAADAAAPVAQTLSVQSVVAGTSNTAGANLTITGSQGTGTGAGGSIIFQVAPAGTAGTAQNALTTALTIAGNGNATFLSTSTTAIGTLNLTNALGLTYGGTGATTQAGAANAILPSQSTNSGKYLTTDGTDVSWGTVSAGGGATGGGTDEVFYENGNTITTNYTITSNKNAMSAGPITINSGVTVTVPSGSRWVIL